MHHFQSLLGVLRTLIGICAEWLGREWPVADIGLYYRHCADGIPHLFSKSFELSVASPPPPCSGGDATTFFSTAKIMKTKLLALVAFTSFAAIKNGETMRAST